MRRTWTVTYISTLICLVALAIASARLASAQTSPPPSQPTAPGQPRLGPDKEPLMKRGDSGQNDAEFVAKAADSGAHEVEAARVAMSRASNSDVMQFAQRMNADHGKANDELKAMVREKSMTWPAEASPKHAAALASLKKLESAAFDRAYMEDQVEGHEAAVELFERQSKDGQDPELKAWAARKLPILREHLQMAKDVKAKLGST